MQSPALTIAFFAIWWFGNFWILLADANVNDFTSKDNAGRVSLAALWKLSFAFWMVCSGHWQENQNNVTCWSCTQVSPRNVTQRFGEQNTRSVSAFIYTKYQRIWKFVPNRYYESLFFFLKQAMKSASDCLHTTHLCQTSVRMKTTDYTARTATCCSLVCSVAVVCLIMLLLLRCEVGGIIQTLRNSYTN